MRKIEPVLLMAGILLVLSLASCGGGAKPKDSDSGADLHQTLNGVPCPNASDFRGTGIGNDENEALAQARSNMALEHFSQKFKSNVNISGQNIDNIASTSTKTSIDQEAALANAQDAKLHFSTRKGSKTGVVACMSRSDAAKSFAERMRPIADSLKFATNNVIEAKHPKLKSEAWQKAKPLYNKFIGLYSIIQSLDKEKATPYEPVNALYSKAETYYLDFCQTAKLYWNPEQDNAYSEIAFSKLSKNLKLEKASCKGNGLSLIYKNTGHKCDIAGISKCSHQPSLLIASCEGAEYRLLEYQNIETYHKKEETAKEMLQEKLKNESFWDKWELEIKQWSPKCE
ncbi:MAG: hypothetical protein FWF67_01365 [Fibromonadales bacterium]|nr:hypothetical protein [Fibromonadales bacterium]